MKLITREEYKPNSGQFDKPYLNEDFNFLSDLLSIKDLKIDFGNRYINENYLNISFDKLFQKISITIEKLELSVGFNDNFLDQINRLISAVSKLSESLKELKLEINFSKEIIEKKSFFKVENPQIQWKKGDPSPFNYVLDCNILKNFKLLEKFSFSFGDRNYTKHFKSNTKFSIKNPLIILNLPNIKEIDIPEEEFQEEDLIKIFSEKGNKKEQFLLQFNENSSEKEIKRYKHNLPEDVKKEYIKIKDDNEYNLTIYGKDIFEILIKRLAKRLNKKI